VGGVIYLLLSLYIFLFCVSFPKSNGKQQVDCLLPKKKNLMS
jgi:hypothetical protein